MSSITRRWLRGSLLVTLLLVALAEGLFIYATYSGYYNGARQAILSRISSISGQLNIVTGANPALTASSRSQLLHRAVEQFDEKDKFEFMLLDSSGQPLITSSGALIRYDEAPADFTQALSSASGQGEMIYTDSGGHRVMAITVLVPYACEDAAAKLPALLERRQALEKLSAAWEELARRKARQAAALEGLSIAEQAAAQKQLLLETVSLRLERQETLLRQNAALQLAHTLEPGKPCPVCGALEHPSPAAGQETLLEPRQLESLRQEEKSARQAQVKAAALAASRKAEADQAAEAVSQQEAAWKEAAASAGDFTREETAAQLAQAAALAEKAKGEAARLEAAKEKLRALEKERDACQQRETALREKLSALEAQAQELERRAQEAQAACAGLDHSALEEAIQAKGRAYDAKEKAAAQLLQEAQEEDAQRERAQAALSLAQQALEKANAQWQACPTPWEERPQLPQLRQQCQTLRQESLTRREELGKAASARQALEGTLQEARRLEEELAALEGQLSRVARLSKSLSGSNPMKMPILQYVLSVMLEEVLGSANRFFATLSRGRYALRLKDGPATRGYGGLDLEVLDGASMLPRSIETLSGGEQFLASLSLAFGLSDVVQNHSGAVRLDSLFIDEGFGSLDGETLDTAMKALAMLQSGGRLIGIISHVSELKNRIPCRVEVNRDAAGFSHAAIKT